MNYSQTLDYLFACLPMFQRIGAAAYKADLDNTIAICNILENPETKLKCIHVAGTNGKGFDKIIIKARYYIELFILRIIIKIKGVFRVILLLVK